MLETKSLVKIYKPKKGVPVRALDGVTLKFPDKGMIFLLGKSGSGKSTLLNVLGGLDKYDDGEIIIKGVSSKRFNQQHFDSYRNTYVGFIFQEYNILEEFTVGANIALALELQGRKASDEELNKILNDVDLTGYGNRRPNELSGGQKQRVAIARALVKNPKIIMADEPSGALDSVTGKQVFDTLKKLSKEKLVIVVSHDRDFADEYADRIIELADGRVISDTTLCDEAFEATEHGGEGITFDGNTAKIPVSYRLTEEDRLAINDYLERLQSGAELEFTQSKKSKKFLPTDQEQIKNTDNSPFKLIKSKLSLKHAFKIGSSGLKYKKFRLVMTILLSCIAFTLFGLVDTFSSYDHIKTTANSVYDSGVKYAAVSKNRLSGEGIDAYWFDGIKITDEDIAKLSAETGVDFSGVITDSSMGYYFEYNIGDLDTDNVINNYYDLDAYSFSGIVEASESDLLSHGYKLAAGRMPDGGKNEIAISEYIFQTFEKSGYCEAKLNEEYVFDISDTVKISDYSDMLGKTLLIENELYEIVGVVDTGFDWSRYEALESDSIGGDAADTIIDFVLYNEFDSAVSYNYTGMMMVGTGFIDRFLESRGNATEINYGHLSFSSEELYFSPQYVAALDDVDKSKIIWLGDEKTVLGENDVIISSGLAIDYLGLAEYDDSENLVIDSERLQESFDMYYYEYFSGDETNRSDYNIVGVYDNGFESNKLSSMIFMAVVSDSLFNEYFVQDSGRFDLALGIMPDNKGDIENLAEYCYTDRDGIRFSFNNPASFELDALNEVIMILADVFLYVGIFFAIFASILLSNFIATSISYKKQEIGILRAIGSRGNDVFRIFFAEAFIIAMINFVLACVGTGFVTFVINSVLRTEVGLLVTVLDFGIRQVLLVFAVSIAVAAVASFLPVKKIASKRPIDAIRNR